MGVKPAGGVNREVWMAEVGAYARGNGHASSPLHQTRLCYSLIPEEPAMVDAAKHTHTAGMDDAFVAALAPKAHKQLGTDAGNALMFSLHLARRVERRVNATNIPDAALREIDAALGSWSRHFNAAVALLQKERRARLMQSKLTAQQTTPRLPRRPGTGRASTRPILAQSSTWKLQKKTCSPMRDSRITSTCFMRSSMGTGTRPTTEHGGTPAWRSLVR